MDAKAMELDATPSPPPQVACTDEQMLQFDAIRRGFAHIEARMAEIGGAMDELIGVIDALASHVGTLRRAQELGAPAADLVTQVGQVEFIFGEVSAQVRRMEAIRGSMLKMVSGGLGLGAGGGGGGGSGGFEAVDALAAGLERIRIGLGP